MKQSPVGCTHYVTLIASVLVYLQYPRFVLFGLGGRVHAKNRYITLKLVFVL
jgi:hypothetical protein